MLYTTFKSGLPLHASLFLWNRGGLVNNPNKQLPNYSASPDFFVGPFGLFEIWRSAISNHILQTRCGFLSLCTVWSSCLPVCKCLKDYYGCQSELRLPATDFCFMPTKGERKNWDHKLIFPQMSFLFSLDFTTWNTIVYKKTILSWTIWRRPSFRGVRVPCLIGLFPACFRPAI